MSHNNSISSFSLETSRLLQSSQELTSYQSIKIEDEVGILEETKVDERTSLVVRQSLSSDIFRISDLISLVGNYNLDPRSHPITPEYVREINLSTVPGDWNDPLQPFVGDIDIAFLLEKDNDMSSMRLQDLLQFNKKLKSLIKSLAPKNKQIDFSDRIGELPGDIKNSVATLTVLPIIFNEEESQMRDGAGVACCICAYFILVSLGGSAIACVIDIPNGTDKDKEGCKKFFKYTSIITASFTAFLILVSCYKSYKIRKITEDRKQTESIILRCASLFEKRAREQQNLLRHAIPRRPETYESYRLTAWFKTLYRDHKQITAGFTPRIELLDS